ncbi:hypothetical protein Esi_0188_0019 [Ectocarpus siliculosus]|uniref:Uncharacterized protein n=1 Tax=Ectocarpus siliculosus TaxID=2880 RepID=D7FPB5_ECTSI|nr:hypothetical protein Esi_0188_0019 [Ectocarpus siliculosus]|eukprot:CBJ30374.1 hypothetical protein Esi_0188_0019 [Ectocarpus siliculosus]
MCPDEIAAAVAAAARTCSRTRRENQPWWEIDLGGAFPVRCIRVHHPDRRTEATKAGASPFVDVSPFWIMTSAGAIGDAAPEEAKQLAISSKRVGSHGKVTVWNLGVNHFAAAVRVQAEGVKSLQLARVEVIKGGGTQQAKDAMQHQLAARTDSNYLPHHRQHHAVPSSSEPRAEVAANAAGGLGHTRPQTCSAVAAGARSSSVAGERCSTTGQKRRRRQRRREEGLPGEDVRRLLLRAMVGYDWVDEFNGKDERVRGAFTEQDVVVLEVQTNPGGKGKTPMLLAVRESPNLFQLLSSGVVEALPDALARAEAQLPQAHRPLGLDWTRFLGVMGLCLESVYSGTGLLAASAVARLFEEKTDDKLEFLTRRRNRLPPRETVNEGAQQHKGKYRGFESAPAVVGADGSIGVAEGTPRGPTKGAKAGSGTTGSSVAAGSYSAEDTSMPEAGSSIGTRDDTLFEAGGSGASRGSRRRDGTPATTTSANGHGGALVSRPGGLVFGGGGGGDADADADYRRKRRGGGAAALKSLLRPQARHEVVRGYGEAVCKRRERQREALKRAPEPDVEPTRAYKPCGLCQAPFPVESLGSTVSLKVLATFLAIAGAPSERFDRKASGLSALHRLPLCVFCGQFFDPDFPGGVIPPTRNAALTRGGGRRRLLGDVSFSSSTFSLESSLFPSSPSLRATAEANGLVPFFDDRFPERWSEAPPPSSAPAGRASSLPPSSLSSPSRHFDGSCSSSSATGQHKGHGSTPSSVAKRRGCGGGGGGGGAGDRQHVGEAMELREIGGLVRRGCSIRDRLTVPP